MTPEQTDGDDGARRGIASGAGITFAGAAIGGMLVLFNEILAARLLGVSAYGLYALAYAFARISEVSSLFGLRVTLLHFLPLQLHANRPDRVIGTIYVALAGPLLISGALAVTLWLGAEFLTGALFDKTGAAKFLRILALAVPFMALSEIIGHVSRGFGRTAPYVVSRNIVPPALFFILLITIGLTDALPTYIPAAFVVAQLVGFGVACYTLTRVVERKIWASKPQLQVGAIYRYALPIFVNTILYMVIAWTDLLMIGHFGEADDLGIYRGCMQFALVFEMMGLAINAATAKFYPVLIASQETARLQKLYSTVLRWVSILAYCAFFLMVFNAPDLLNLLGDDFVTGAGVLVLLAVAGLMRTLGASAGFLLVVGKHQTNETFNVTTGAVLNIALNLLLIPRMGILGAALATALTMALVATMRLMQVRRVFAVSTPVAGIARTGALLLLTALPIALIAHYSGTGVGQGFGWLVTRLAVAGIAIMIASWFFVAHQEDRDLIKSLLHRKKQHGESTA